MDTLRFRHIAVGSTLTLPYQATATEALHFPSNTFSLRSASSFAFSDVLGLLIALYSHMLASVPGHGLNSCLGR